MNPERSGPHLSGYVPPPPMVAPPEGWRPPRVVEPAAPRTLPSQHLGVLDAAEEQARQLTRVFGIVAGAVLALVLCVICGRAIF